MQITRRPSDLRTTTTRVAVSALIAGTALAVTTPAVAGPTQVDATRTQAAQQRCPFSPLGDGTWVKSSPGGPRIEWWPAGEIRYVPVPLEIEKKHILIARGKWVRKGTIAKRGAACI